MNYHNNAIIQSIIAIIQRRLENPCKIFLFGSRAQGTAHLHSDYDIGLLSDQTIPRQTLLRIKNDCDNLPANIDIVDFARTHSDFQDIATRHIIPLL